MLFDWSLYRISDFTRSQVKTYRGFGAGTVKSIGQGGGPGHEVQESRRKLHLGPEKLFRRVAVSRLVQEKTELLIVKGPDESFFGFKVLRQERQRKIRSLRIERELCLGVRRESDGSPAFPEAVEARNDVAQDRCPRLPQRLLQELPDRLGASRSAQLLHARYGGVPVMELVAGNVVGYRGNISFYLFPLSASAEESLQLLLDFGEYENVPGSRGGLLPVRGRNQVVQRLEFPGDRVDQCLAVHFASQPDRTQRARHHAADTIALLRLFGKHGILRDVHQQAGQGRFRLRKRFQGGAGPVEIGQRVHGDTLEEFGPVVGIFVEVQIEKPAAIFRVADLPCSGIGRAPAEYPVVFRHFAAGLIHGVLEVAGPPVFGEYARHVVGGA